MPEHNQLLRGLTHVCGVKATSDLPETWNASQKAQMRIWLESSQAIAGARRYTFAIEGRSVDFASAMPLPPFPRYFYAVLSEILGWLGNLVWALRLWHWLLRYD